jgi:PKD repeat protein
MRLHSCAIALVISLSLLFWPSSLGAQCAGNNCPQKIDGQSFVTPPPTSCPKNADYCDFGIPGGTNVGGYGKYVYMHAQWGPARFSLSDPKNPVFTNYSVMDSNGGGPIEIGGDGFATGVVCAAAEAPDGSSAVFFDWKGVAGAGSAHPMYAVHYGPTSGSTFLGPVDYDPGSGIPAADVVGGRYFGYIPTQNSSGRYVAVVEATSSAVNSVGTLSWPVSALRREILSVPSSDTHYLVGVSSAGGSSTVYLAKLGSGGLPTLSNSTSIPGIAIAADVGNVNGSLYVFTYNSTTGIYAYAVNSDLSISTQPYGGGYIPAPSLSNVHVVGQPLPVIIGTASTRGLRLFGTKFLAAGSCLPSGPDISVDPSPSDPTTGLNYADYLNLPNSGGVVVYRFFSIPITDGTDTRDTLGAQYFKATCLVGDTTSPPTAGINVTNTSPHYASDGKYYFGDTFTIADQSSSGAPLLGAIFDLNYVSPTFDKDIIVTSPGPPFSFNNVYLPCDIAAGGNTSGNGCYVSAGSGSKTSFLVADQSWNKNNPSDSPPSNTATQSIAFLMPQAKVANPDDGTTVQVLTGGTIDAGPTTGWPHAFCWMWSTTTSAPAVNTSFSGCNDTNSQPTVPATTKSLSLAVGYYPDNALAAPFTRQVQQVDVLANLTWSPTQPVRSNGGSSTFTVTATRQKGPSITIASVNIWIDKVPSQGNSVPLSPCSASQSAPCYLLQQSDLNGPSTVVAPNDLSATLYIHARYGYSGGSLSSVETVPQSIQFIDYQPTPTINITGSGVSLNPFSTPHWHILKGSAAQFTDATTADAGHITTASWDFGDGSNGIQVNGDATTTPANYTYTRTGTFTISMCVNNASASPGCTSDQVSVDPPTPFSVTAHASPSSVQPNQSVSFSVTASGGNGGSISTCDWDFGDGSAHSSNCGTSHSYSTAGTYHASVGVTTSGGDSGNGSVTVSVSSGGGGGPDCQDYPYLPGCSGSGGSFAVSINGPAYGLPGQNLSFTATANNQTGSVIYNWDFDDGTTATGPSVAHSWAVSGTYNVSLSAQDDAAKTAQASFPVTISTSPCPPQSFQCQGLSPGATLQSASGSGNFNSWALLAGGSVTFTADETSDGTNYDWKFSDDGREISGADQRTVTHYYPNPSPSGSPFTVTLTVTNGGDSAIGTFSITVQPRPFSALVVLGAGHLDDSAHGYTWKTNLSLFNPTANTMNIFLDYEKRDPYNWQNGDPSKLPYEATGYPLGPGESVRFGDIVNNSYVTSANAGDPGQRGDVGFLYIQYTGSAPPQATASIYAERASDGATFGSALPIIPVNGSGNGISSISLTQARLVGLKNGSQYRSILYVFNPSSQQAEYSVTVYRSDGTTLAGYPQTITVNPFEWQIGSLSSADWGVPDDSQTYFAKIVPTNANSNAPVFAQASVVDNVSGDSVVITDNTTPPIGIPNGQQFTYYVPGAGRIDSNGHHWRTDLWMYNPGSVDQHIQLVYRYSNSDGSEIQAPPTALPTVPAHGQLSLTDVIGQLFGLTAVNSQGTLMINFSGGTSPTDNAIAIAGRVYDDQGSAGTVGTQLQAFYSPNGDELDGGSSKSLVLTGLVADASGRWRSNIGIATPSTNTAETQLTITVYDDDGNAVYGPAPWTINQSSDVANGVRSFVQIPISTYVSSTYTGGLSAVISKVTGGPIIGYGTVIDGKSGDSVYIPMVKTQ